VASDYYSDMLLDSYDHDNCVHYSYSNSAGYQTVFDFDFWSHINPKTAVSPTQQQQTQSLWDPQDEPIEYDQWEKMMMIVT
jgi:hypothetical protein